MKTLWISIKFTILCCVLLCGGYVLVLWGIATISTPNHGQSENIELNGKIVGATNVGQSFTQLKYFWGRPSAVNYNGESSGGSNKAPSNPEYLKEVANRIDKFLVAHPYLKRSDIPSEMVTASGSGLDPHISPNAAQIQILRVAKARNMSVEKITEIVHENTHKSILGPPTINVLALNIALDNADNS